jgi:NAD(P)-dependent dehydrogenase (short-subunit alcohol dehydrogenase family)
MQQKGSICSVQVAAMVQLGANATIIGRNKEKTETKASEIQALRKGSKVLGISADVRNIKALEAAVERTVAELGRLDYVMSVPPSSPESACQSREVLTTTTAAALRVTSWPLSTTSPRMLSRR